MYPDIFISEFIDFAKEYGMALDKVRWSLIDGLKEKQNLINIIKKVLVKLINEKIIEKGLKGSKDSHSEDYNSYVFKYKKWASASER